MSSEKQISYTHRNSYSTLNECTDTTKNVWLVFHGMGYLSRYFIRHFAKLDPLENFIVAPQAPSKYYQGTAFKHVGASWLTRENTLEETKNVLNYVDAVWNAEKPSHDVRLIILGYSQGVSIATRWMASRKMHCDELILHSGGIPVELVATDFKYLSKSTNVTYLYGDEDEYITEARKTEEHLKGSKLFGERLKVHVFKGIHEFYVPFIDQIIRKF